MRVCLCVRARRLDLSVPIIRRALLRKSNGCTQHVLLYFAGGCARLLSHHHIHTVKEHDDTDAHHAVATARKSFKM